MFLCHEDFPKFVGDSSVEMASSFSRFLIVNRVTAASYNAASRICHRLNAAQLSRAVALESNQPDCGNLNGGGLGYLSQVYDGLLFTQRNSKVPSKANHGARPCSHVYRYIKVECKWYGPRWYRKRLKKVFRNSENKIMP